MTSFLIAHVICQFASCCMVVRNSRIRRAVNNRLQLQGNELSFSWSTSWSTFNKATNMSFMQRERGRQGERRQGIGDTVMQFQNSVSSLSVFVTVRFVLHLVSFITCLFHNSVSEFSFHDILSVSVLCQFSTLVGVPHLSVSSLVCCYLCRFHTAAAAATAVAADKCFNYERRFGFKSIVDWRCRPLKEWLPFQLPQ